MVRTLKPWRGSSVQPLEDLYKEMDHLVHNLFGDDKRSKAPAFIPHLDLSETEEGYQLNVDLPGIKSDDISVELHDNVLTISGKRETTAREEGKTYHRVERLFGEFSRSIKLPETIDEDRLSADYVNGVLTVSLPKTEEVKPKRIEINIASNGNSSAN